MFVYTKSLQVFGQCSLNSLVKSTKVRSCIRFHLTFEPMDIFVTLNIFTAHYTVVVHFCVHASCFYDKTFLSWSISDQNCKVTKILTHSLFFLVWLLCIILSTFFVWSWLSIKSLNFYISYLDSNKISTFLSPTDLANDILIPPSCSVNLKPLSFRKDSISSN